MTKKECQELITKLFQPKDKLQAILQLERVQTMERDLSCSRLTDRDLAALRAVLARLALAERVAEAAIAVRDSDRGLTFVPALQEHAAALDAWERAARTEAK